MLDKAQPRDPLRAAITEREKCKARVEVATATFARAKDLLREGEARLAEFAAAEEEIISHRADRVRAWAGSGGKKPSMDVPDNLIACRKSRDEATVNVNAARTACKGLSDDLGAAKSALMDAERSAREAALSVVFEEAERIAERLDAVKREMWQLASALRGLSQIWLPSGTDQTLRPIQLPAQALAALHAEEPQTPPNHRPEAQAEAAWRSFHTTLLADPDVKFTDTTYVALRRV